MERKNPRREQSMQGMVQSRKRSSFEANTTRDKALQAASARSSADLTPAFGVSANSA
jgi:hypothetical protein